MSKLILIFGKSGSGKDTLQSALLDKYKNITPLPLYTTRAKRNEEDNKYTFLTKDKFDDLYEKKVIFEKFSIPAYLSTNDGNTTETENMIYYGTGISNEKLCCTVCSGDTFRINKFIGQYGLTNIAFVYTYCEPHARVDRIMNRYLNTDGKINYAEIERREKAEAKVYQDYDKKYISRIKNIETEKVKLFKKERFIVVNTNNTNEEELVFKLYQKLIKLGMV